MAIDITLRGVLSSSGELHTNAVNVDGAVFSRVRADEEATHPELLTWSCRLVVVATETGGRWSSEATDVVRQLSFAKAREVFVHMRFPIAFVWERRWTRMFVDGMFLRFCFFFGGIFRQVWNLVLDRWRATVFGGIVRARFW